MRPFNLRLAQPPMVDWLLAHERCALWAGMGLGKTSASLYTLDLMRILGTIGESPTLVVGPMRVARDTWPEEVAKWEQFQDTRIMPLVGTPAQRRDRLKVKADVYTLSYELLPWLVEHFEARWPFRQVIADESDRLKGLREKKGGISLTGKKRGASTERAFQLARVAHSLVRRWVNLTGTPIGNQGYLDLWGQTWYLDRGERLGRTYSAFERRWFKPKWNGYGVEILPHAKGEIDKLLADICLTIDPKDYYDLAEPIVTPIMVNLPPKVRALYKDLESKMFAEIESHGELRVMNKGGLVNKCLQIAGGAVYTKEPEWAPLHGEKIEALESIQHEAGGMPLLVQTNFRHEAPRIQRAFPKAVDLSTTRGLAAFKAGDAPMGYAHPKSMGHGIDGLQNVTNILVRFGLDWNTRDWNQYRERIGPMRQFQAGLDRPYREFQILARDTVDEDVIKVHTTNCTVLDALMGAMKGTRATT